LNFKTDETPGAVLNGLLQQTIAPDQTSEPVTAVAPSNYTFLYWMDSDGITYSSNPFTIKNVRHDMQFTAHFQQSNSGTEEFTVAFVTDGTTGAAIEGEAVQTVQKGNSTAPVTAQPPDGYVFLYWTDTDGTQYSDNPVTIENISGNLTLTAHFSIIMEQGYSLGSLIIIDSKDHSQLGGLFEKTPSVYAVYSDRIKNRIMKASAKSVLKIKTPQSQYTCYWNKKTKLFNYGNLKRSLKNGSSTFQWLQKNPIEPLECELHIKTSKPEKMDIKLTKISLMPPQITSVEINGKNTFDNGVYNLKNHSQIVIKGKYFGAKAPIIAIEIPLNGQYKYRRLKIIKNFKFPSPKGIPGKSPMNPATGDSELSAAISIKEITSGTYNLILYNKLGITAVKVKF
jgi:uncharacterized repeat protein (TIGR02543 family)